MLNRSRFILIALTLVAVQSKTVAQSTWNNSAGGGWNTASNWTPTTIPTSAATAQLIFGGSTQYTSILDIGTGAFSVKSLTFNSSFTSASPAITISRSGTQTITLADATSGIVQNGSGSVLISAPVALVNTASANMPVVSGSGTGDVTLSSLTVGTNAQTFTFSGLFNININAFTKVSGNKTFTNNLDPTKLLTFGSFAMNATNTNNQAIFTGTGSTRITGNITESTGGTSGGVIIKQSTGTLTLSGNNTFTGATTISAGVVNIQSVNALGGVTTGTTVANGASLQIQGGLSFAAEPLSIAGQGISNTGALRNVSGTNTWTGPITLTAAARIQADTGSILTITAPIGGAFALTTSGSGTINLNAANTYSGATTVAAGTLVQGNATALGTSNSFTVALGAVLDASQPV